MTVIGAALRKEVVDLRKSGKTFREICELTGVGRSRARRILLRSVGSVDRPKGGTYISREELLRRCATGETIYAIAKKLGRKGVSYLYTLKRECDLAEKPIIDEKWQAEIAAYHTGKSRKAIAYTMKVTEGEVGVVFRSQHVEVGKHLQAVHQNTKPRFTLPIEDIHYLREMGNSFSVIARIVGCGSDGAARAHRRFREKLETLPVVAVDFDGVIHSYENGWCDGKITGEIITGFFEWVLQCHDKLHIVIYSCRNSTRHYKRAMAKWILAKWKEWSRENNPNEVPLAVSYSDTKPIATLYIDDRGFQFKGNWSDDNLKPERISEFKTWQNQ